MRRLGGILLPACLVLASVSSPMTAMAGNVERTLVVREGRSASLLGGDFSIEVLKIRGYSIVVRIDGERRVLKLGQSVASVGASCSVRFKKISPETRIARFLTDCP